MTFDQNPNIKHSAQFIFHFIYVEFFFNLRFWVLNFVNAIVCLFCLYTTLISVSKAIFPWIGNLSFFRILFFSENFHIQQTCYHSIPFNCNAQVYIFFSLNIYWLLQRPNFTTSCNTLAFITFYIWFQLEILHILFFYLKIKKKKIKMGKKIVCSKINKSFIRCQSRIYCRIDTMERCAWCGWLIRTIDVTNDE